MQIQSSEIPDIARSEAKLTIAESGNMNLRSDVQAVLDISPRFHRVTSFTKSASGTTSATSNTIYTAENDRDTYITGATLAYVKDATCDAADGFLLLRVSIDGVFNTLILFPLLTLTAQSGSISIVFPDPIKVSKSGFVQTTQPTFTAGKLIRSATIYGYQIT